MLYKDVALFDIDGLYESANAQCETLYPNAEDEKLIRGCYDSNHNLVNYFDVGKLPKGFLLSEDEIITDLENNLDDVQYNTYSASFTNWQISMLLVREYIQAGAITGSESTANSFDDSLANLTVSDEFQNSFYGTDDLWRNGIFGVETEENDDGEQESVITSVKIDFEKYFKDSKVVVCNWNEKEGWFDVFIFALNSTQSVFGIAVIIFGFVYTFTKWLQTKIKGGSA